MKKTLLGWLCAMMLLPQTVAAQGWPSNYEGVMLQAFYWDSYTDTAWPYLESQSDELAEFFDLIWIPQSGNCVYGYGENKMGYTPVYYFDHNSSFGSEAELRSLISTMKAKGVGMIADVVINHRSGVSNDVDFPAETWNGKTYQMTTADICKTDECNRNGFPTTGANDTGDDFNGSRDLDHTSANVQDNIKAYLNFLINDLGYAGFRYDMVKGYSASYTALYNVASKPEFSVGEYWDGYASIERWIDNTKDGGVVQSAAFDFPTKYLLNDACKTFQWNKLNTSASLIANDNYKRYAVTFVDNHDTYRTDYGSTNPLTSNITAANAYIISMPGTPCVFLPHWQKYKGEIKAMIDARKLAGIHNQSKATVKVSSANQIAFEVEGTKGKLLLCLGNTTYNAGDDYVEACSGTNYKIWVSKSCNSVLVTPSSGEYEQGTEVKITPVTTDSGAKVCYTTDGSDPYTAYAKAVTGATTLAINDNMTLRALLVLSDGTKTKEVRRDYTMAQPFQPTTISLYVKSPLWNPPYVYAWDSDGTASGAVNKWPGAAMTATTINGETWYKYDFKKNTADYRYNVVLNDGGKGSQTVDITNIADNAYYEILTTQTSGKYMVQEVTETVGIEDVIATAKSVTTDNKVYDLQGRVVSRYGKTASLPAGTYIINGRKVLVR